MSELATRLDRSTFWANLEPVPAPMLPPEAPLEMPRQAFDEPLAPEIVAPHTSPRDIRRRRQILAAGTLTLTALVAAGPFVLFNRHGFDTLSTLGFGVFLVLAAAIACWFCSAVAGHWVLRTGREQDDLSFAPHPPLPTQRTALLMPLYNEDAEATFARLAGLDASLARLGASDAFDIFVLSDSRKDDAIAAELAAYRALRPQAHSRLFMRRRNDNAERKAGNIAEWVRRFGGAYEFMVILDADSTMAGDTLLRLVDAMQRHPRVGLIQTAPTITNAGSVFARMSQFGVRMYGRVAAAGLAWWA
ncbi:MAG: glucans biosynthesis glucosyltransferase MdoH, partial [Proteobacteria bacterium]|nr:glucans biosynthesis glucosyltransferase MdoH [Pseudomonadota bacterium]